MVHQGVNHAVVGTERSTGHMLYIVSEDYLDAFGHTSTINSNTERSAREEVVEWLTSLISKSHLSPPILGENILLEIQRKNVRTSRDWIDGKQVEVESKKDIKSFISSISTDVSKCNIKEPGNCENQMAPKLVASEDNKMAPTSKHSPEKQDTDALNLKKCWCIDFLAGNKD